MKNIYLCGFMASGKTTIAKEISRKTNLYFLDTDIEIEKITNLPILEIFKRYSEKYFRNLETMLFKKIKHKNNLIVATGGGIFSNNKNIKIAKQSGTIIFLNVQLKNCIKRFANSKRPLTLGKQYNFIKNLYNKRYSKYLKIAEFVVNNNELPESCCEKILKYIKSLHIKQYKTH